MEIKGKVEIKGLRICDLDDGEVFVFCDENVPMLKCSDYIDNIYAIQLNNGTVFDIYEEELADRPVQKIKAVLTVE